jgi:hypothetical protein
MSIGVLKSTALTTAHCAFPAATLDRHEHDLGFPFTGDIVMSVGVLKSI